MGEFHGQILGLVIVIAIFAAITPVMISLFDSIAEDVVTETEAYTNSVDEKYVTPTSATGTSNLLRVAGLDIKVMSFAD